MNAAAPTRVTTRPEVTAAGAWRFPVPQQHPLPNGMQLLTVDLPGQHVLSLRVALKLPLAGEVPGTEGSTLLMARALDEGTTGRHSDEIAALLERHGIAWGSGAGERGVHLGVETTVRHLQVALELATECLSEPTFPEADVARLARHRLADIAHDRADPGTRAALEFIHRYYDPAERAHTPLGGTRDSISALTSEHLRQRHAQLCPVGGSVVLAGDLSTIPDPVGMVTATLGTWSAGAQPQPPRPRRAAVRAQDAEGIVLVPRPGLPQTELYLGRPGPDRRTPHGWGTFQALGMVLGGSPHARLDRVLREERGYTYGMRAGFRPRAVGGLCVVGGSVRADATVAALHEMVSILDTPGADLTEQEVRAGADYLARTAPSRYATADVVADELISLLIDDLPLDTVTRTLDDLHGLDVQRVATAWDEVRAGPGWTVVAVGDPAHATGLEELAQDALGGLVVAE